MSSFFIDKRKFFFWKFYVNVELDILFSQLLIIQIVSKLIQNNLRVLHKIQDNTVKKSNNILIVFEKKLKVTQNKTLFNWTTVI